MNIRNIVIITIAFLTLAACGEDRREESAKYTEVPKWIEGVMRANYYWYKDMPEKKKLNFFTEDTEAFFVSLLSAEDGKSYNGRRYYYSSLTALAESDTRSLRQTDYSYGFDFVLYDIGSLGTVSAYAAHVLYVLPESPAGEAGLKRGDWIVKVNEEAVTDKNYTALYGGQAAEFAIGIWQENGIVFDKTLRVETARIVKDNPVHYYNFYESEYAPDKRIGYLVYNHFTAGDTDGDSSYDDELLDLSAAFKAFDVNEFVLDLRYNNGGLLSSACLMCAILAPASAVGKSLGYLEYNDQYEPQTEKIMLNAALLKGGSNLNLNTLYVLTGPNSASASEMVINSLSPYMKVVLIGTQTEGKNVGSVTYKDDKYPWELHPIICKIYNSENTSNYANGFTPDYIADEGEMVNLDRFLPLGNPNEFLLNTALNIIAGTYREEGTPSDFRSAKITPVRCSLDRKATNGVVIR